MIPDSGERELAHHDLLRQIEFFRGLGESDLDRLSKSFVEMAIPGEHRVFAEGEPSEAFYVIKTGGVVIYRDAVGKPLQLVARLGPGDHFGEFGLFEDAAHASSARTTEPTRLLKAANGSLVGFLDDHPAVAVHMQTAAARRHTLNAAATLEADQSSDVRIRIQREVVLALEDGSTHVATLDNLSTGGLSLSRTPAGWTKGDVVCFELGFGAHRLPCEARVAWLRGEAVGLAFLTTTADHAVKIRQTLRFLLDRTPTSWTKVTAETPPS